jgi:hypothetical protein
VFQQLTKYLSQYKQVSIPEIGSIELVYQSASLDVPNKRIEPPSYLPRYSDRDTVKEHQLNFLAADLNTDKVSVQQQLQIFGRELQKRIHNEAFLWRGIGRLEKTDSRILFHPDVLPNEGLQHIKAEKILRENVMHTVLVGEQEVQKKHLREESVAVSEKRSYLNIIGWILAAAAIGFIVFMLYQDNFQTTASGNKTKIVPARTQPLSK